MLPIVFEWQWDIAHFVFMGFFYLALLVIVGGLLYCLFKTTQDLNSGEEEHHSEH